MTVAVRPALEKLNVAGHSHWANIARKKSLIDAKRGKLWSKLAKGIIVAAKHGGADPDANLRLRYTIDAAKAEHAQGKHQPRHQDGRR